MTSTPRSPLSDGRSHSTPATSAALVLALAAMTTTTLHGLTSGDWTPLGTAALAAWVVFLLALVADMTRREHQDR